MSAVCSGGRAVREVADQRRIRTSTTQDADRLLGEPVSTSWGASSVEDAKPWEK
jgi:hypothetical protein